MEGIVSLRRRPLRVLAHFSRCIWLWLPGFATFAAWTHQVNDFKCHLEDVSCDEFGKLCLSNSMANTIHTCNKGQGSQWETQQKVIIEGNWWIISGPAMTEWFSTQSHSYVVVNATGRKATIWMFSFAISLHSYRGQKLSEVYSSLRPGQYAVSYVHACTVINSTSAYEYGPLGLEITSSTLPLSWDFIKWRVLCRAFQWYFPGKLYWMHQMASWQRHKH